MDAVSGPIVDGVVVYGDVAADEGRGLWVAIDGLPRRGQLPDTRHGAIMDGEVRRGEHLNPRPRPLVDGQSFDIPSGRADGMDGRGAVESVEVEVLERDIVFSRGVIGRDAPPGGSGLDAGCGVERVGVGCRVAKERPGLPNPIPRPVTIIMSGNMRPHRAVENDDLWLGGQRRAPDIPAM